MGSVLQLMLQGLFLSVDKQVAQLLWTEFAGLFTSPLPVLGDPVVHKLQALAMTVALAALPVVIAYQALRRSLDAMAGESTVAPELLIKRCFIAGMTVTGISLFAWIAATLGAHLQELVGALTPSVNIFKLLFGTGEEPSNLTGTVFFLVFLGAVGAVCIQRAIIGAEFTLLLILGAFVGLSRASEEHSPAWQSWKRELVAILVTPAIQLVVLFLFAERLAGMSSEQQTVWFGSLARWIDSGAMLYLLWNTPRWARQFTYSAGVAHGIAGVGANVSRVAVMQMILRSATKAV